MKNIFIIASNPEFENFAIYREETLLKQYANSRVMCKQIDSPFEFQELSVSEFLELAKQFPLVFYRKPYEDTEALFKLFGESYSYICKTYLY